MHLTITENNSQTILKNKIIKGVQMQHSDNQLRMSELARKSPKHKMLTHSLMYQHLVIISITWFSLQTNVYQQQSHQCCRSDSADKCLPATISPVLKKWFLHETWKFHFIFFFFWQILFEVLFMSPLGIQHTINIETKIQTRRYIFLI